MERDTKQQRRFLSSCCKVSHVITCLAPIIAGSLILSVLYQLLSTLEITIYDQSVSDSLSEMEPYLRVLVPIAVGGSIMFVITAMRNIQITVYFTRQRSYSRFLYILNWLASVLNVAAYVGFMMLAFNKNNGSDPEIKRHFIGTAIYFACVSVYGMLDSFLLLQQKQYPAILKVLMVLIALAATGAAAYYSYTALTPESDAVEYEWIAVALETIYIVLYSILFHIDPVEDELLTFFCCSRTRDTLRSDEKTLRESNNFYRLP